MEKKKEKKEPKKPRVAVKDLLVGEARVNELTSMVQSGLMRIGEDKKYFDTLIAKLDSVEGKDNPALPYMKLIGFFAEELNSRVAKDEKFQAAMEDAEKQQM